MIMNRLGSKKILFLLNSGLVNHYTSISCLGYRRYDRFKRKYIKIFKKFHYKEILEFKKQEEEVIASKYYLMIRYSVNNILVSIYNYKGQVFFNKTAGIIHKGTKKYTVSAAEQLGRDLAENLNRMYIYKFIIVLKSPINKFIHAVIRGLGSRGIFRKNYKKGRMIGYLVRISKAHNGVRRCKLRRV